MPAGATDIGNMTASKKAPDNRIADKWVPGGRAAGGKAAGKRAVAGKAAGRKNPQAEPLGIMPLEEFFLFRGRMENTPRTVLPFHRSIFTTVTNWALGKLAGGARHLAICMPPRHGKTVIAHDAVAWLTGLFPESQWIYASYSERLANAQTFRIREIMDSDWYGKIFPAAGLHPGKKSQKYFETLRGGHVYGTGLEGSITGFGAGRKRAEFGGGIIIDDPLKPADARSHARRSKANNWFSQTLLSRRNCDATPILAIMQRLHPEDLVGHVTATMPGEWELLSIPALEEGATETLWPDTFSMASALRLKDLDPATFGAQYQQNPELPGGNMIKRAWWKTYKPTDLGTGLIFLTADTAFKARSHNDASVIRAWEGTRSGLYCLDAVYGRWEFPRLLQEAKEFWQKWATRGAREFWVEDKASGTPLAQLLRDNNVPAQDWRPKDFDFPEDKVGRMNEAAWAVHGGRVLIAQGEVPICLEQGVFLHTDEQSRALVEECAAFSPDMSHTHDDHCDTLTMAVSLWLHAGGTG
ncbi:hypothetical protein LJC46_09535 [Desulfovibrio sp. OttesenSCG-928-G15]|nr:hypothetical protein [Desulfovibrio sp. OttesenSCG-928-G15]